MKPYLDNSAVRVYLNSVDDSQPEQYMGVQGLDGEKWAKAMRVQPFGLSTNPNDGSHGVGLALGGRREQIFLLGVEDPKTRPKNLPRGATALYNASGEIIKMVGKTTVYTGDSFTFKAGGVTVVIDGGGVTITGGKVTHNGHNIGSTHLHTKASGPANSGPPV